MEERARKILKQLRPALGMTVRHDGDAYKLIELLEDELTIVLEACHKHTEIQPDQMGEAHRRVPLTKTIPVLVGDQEKAINSIFLELDLPVQIDI